MFDEELFYEEKTPVIKDVSPIEEEVLGFDKDKIQNAEVQEECISEVCKPELSYGDADKHRNFVVDNLFSELVSDYQRSQARFHLGISEAYALIWGNIKGNISNQQDLHDYIISLIDLKLREHDIDDVLDTWWTEIQNALSQKLDKLSPHLEGKPTTTLPSMNDDSDRIASTKWVNNKLSDSGEFNLKYISLSEEFMYYGDAPKDIILTWDYYDSPTRQSIDGEVINNSIRSYTFNNVDSDKLIHFSYDLGDKTYNRFINFNKVYAYYVNNDDSLDEAIKFKDFPLIVNSSENKFVYLYIPNDENARIFVDNILGGFKRVESVIENGINYIVYRTVNNNLGELHITYESK